MTAQDITLAARLDRALLTLGAWLLAILWILPLAYAVWTAFHPSAYETNFSLTAPLTLENFPKAWVQAPFARYFLNTMMLVAMTLTAQLVLSTLAGLCLCAVEISRQEHPLHAGAVAADGHAGHPSGQELRGP